MTGADTALRATFELDPAAAARELARIESTGLRTGPARAAARVVDVSDGLATLDFPVTNSGGDVTLLVSSLFAGEWADSTAFRRCRLVRVEWPDGLLPGPAFAAAARVLVGAIVKPSLGLSPEEFAATAAALGRGGADLVKDDELLGDPAWCPLAQRVPRVASELPEGTRYAANVSGPPESLLERARHAVELGAGAVMVNAFAQGLGSLRALRHAELGVPLFAHRVGAALWARGRDFGVAPPIVAELTRLCGGDHVQVGSFSGTVYDSDEEVRAQVTACGRPLAGVPAATAVLGGGVGAANAAEQVERSGASGGMMVLVGSAGYEHPGGVEEGVRATVEAVARWR